MRGMRLGLAVFCVSAWLGADSALAVTATTTFTSPGVHQFTVPAGVTSVDVTTVGAAGGRAGVTETGCSAVGVAGEGALVSATVPVSPGGLLQAGVGAVGADGCS